MSPKVQKPAVGIQQQVVEKFLKQLKTDKVSEAVIRRLEKVITDQSVSELNIKKALLPDETTS